jgi:hypothetical protein
MCSSGERCLDPLRDVPDVGSGQVCIKGKAKDTLDDVLADWAAARLSRPWEAIQ